MRLLPHSSSRRANLENGLFMFMLWLQFRLLCSLDRTRCRERELEEMLSSSPTTSSTVGGPRSDECEDDEYEGYLRHDPLGSSRRKRRKLQAAAGELGYRATRNLAILPNKAAPLVCCMLR